MITRKEVKLAKQELDDQLEDSLRCFGTEGKSHPANLRFCRVKVWLFVFLSHCFDEGVLRCQY